jgi:hypothetical protein
MSKHTPGPWMFGIRGDEKPIEKPFDYCGPGFYDNPAIFGSDGTEVAGCDEYMIFNSEADVRLIVAAPDLLEAAKHALETLDSKHNFQSAEWRHMHYLAFEELKNAIAKATGETR